MASGIWQRKPQIAIEQTCCHHYVDYSISSKGSFMCTIPCHGFNPVVVHWLKRSDSHVLREGMLQSHFGCQSWPSMWDEGCGDMKGAVRWRVCSEMKGVRWDKGCGEMKGAVRWRVCGEMKGAVRWRVQWDEGCAVRWRVRWDEGCAVRWRVCGEMKGAVRWRVQWDEGCSEMKGAALSRGGAGVLTKGHAWSLQVVCLLVYARLQQC